MEPSTHPAADTQSSEQPLKRKRDSKHRCITCWQKKKGCDGNRPQCGRCAKNERNCNWPEDTDYSILTKESSAGVDLDMDDSAEEDADDCETLAIIKRRPTGSKSGPLGAAVPVYFASTQISTLNNSLTQNPQHKGTPKGVRRGNRLFSQRTREEALGVLDPSQSPAATSDLTNPSAEIFTSSRPSSASTGDQSSLDDMLIPDDFTLFTTASKPFLTAQSTFNSALKSHNPTQIKIALTPLIDYRKEFDSLSNEMEAYFASREGNTNHVTSASAGAKWLTVALDKDICDEMRVDRDGYIRQDPEKVLMADPTNGNFRFINVNRDIHAEHPLPYPTVSTARLPGEQHVVMDRAVMHSLRVEARQQVNYTGDQEHGRRVTFDADMPIMPEVEFDCYRQWNEKIRQRIAEAQASDEAAWRVITGMGMGSERA